MDDDPELAAIRARLRAEMLGPAAGEGQGLGQGQGQGILVDLDEAGFDAFVRAHENVVVDCWAPWCGPCRIVGPIVEQLSREMAGRFAFGKLNVDLAPRLSQTFGIQSIPTLLVFRQARLVDRIVGAYPKPQLAALLERQLGRRASGSPGPRRL
ncbi:MAG TPA: thioredoxin [Candidatus Thermoplasmatota archaeon]|nr:thioredoxin [Candidatus Thermoplasmatota archaeon]